MNSNNKYCTMTFRTFLSAGILATATLLSAQTPQPADSTSVAQSVKEPSERIRAMLYHGPVITHRPILSDSTSLSGKAWSVSSLADTSVPVLEAKRHRVVSADATGRFALQRTATDPATTYQTHYYATTVRSGGYARGKISIETAMPWELFLDGVSVGQGQLTPAGTEVKPVETDVTLTPATHQLTIRLVTNDTTLTADRLGLRVGFTPDRVGGDVTFGTERKQYADLTYMIYEPAMTSTSISPSGRYSVLRLREYTDDAQAITRTYLYEGTRRMMELTGSLASAQWMNGRDVLYYDAPTRQGRTIYSWSPVGARTEVIARGIPADVSYSFVLGEEALLLYTQEKGTAYKTTLDRFDSPRERIAGYRDRSFLSLYTCATGQIQPLTFGNRSTYVQSISPTGERIIFATSTPTPTQVPFSRSDFYELDLRTMRVDTLFAETGGISQVMYTARAGELLVAGSADAFDYVGSVLPHGSAVNTYDTQLFLYSQAKRQARPLTKVLDRTVSSVQVSDKRFEAVFMAEVGYDRVLYHVDLASGAIRRLSQAETFVKGYSLSGDGETVTYYGQSDRNADRYYSVSVKRGREELIYDLSAEKLRDVVLGDVKDWNWTAPDGTVVQGFYCLPPTFDPARQYPLLVYYYGGTAPVYRTMEGAYSPQMLASMGYVVYVLNPSGATGYGQEYAARHINAWGKRTADEIIGAVKDFAGKHSFINVERIGCMGASYGGFMTMYLQTQTDMFAAACSHAGISSISSYWGEGYWGVGYSTVASRDSYPWNNPKLYTEQSPLFLADRVKTPLLLIHGLSDTNVPIGESWQMFNALRILGKPVEFVGVYEEDHHILNPRKRHEWTSAIMAFFAKYLQDDPTWWNDLFPGK